MRELNFEGSWEFWEEDRCARPEQSWDGSLGWNMVCIMHRDAAGLGFGWNHVGKPLNSKLSTWYSTPEAGGQGSRDLRLVSWRGESPEGRTPWWGLQWSGPEALGWWQVGMRSSSPCASSQESAFKELCEGLLEESDGEAPAEPEGKGDVDSQVHRPPGPEKKTEQQRRREKEARKLVRGAVG